MSKGAFGENKLPTFVYSVKDSLDSSFGVVPISRIFHGDVEEFSSSEWEATDTSFNRNNNGLRNRRRRSSLTAAASSRRRQDAELSESILNLLSSYDSETSRAENQSQVDKPNASGRRVSEQTMLNGEKDPTSTKKSDTIRYVIEDVVIEDSPREKKPRSNSLASLGGGPPAIIEEECDCGTCRMNRETPSLQNDRLYSSGSTDSVIEEIYFDDPLSRSVPNSINKPPNLSEYRLLSGLLRSEGRQIDCIKGDGNCFFRAVSKEIYGTESCHRQLRQAVVDVIEKYPRDHEQFLDSGESLHDHIIEMRKTSSWATSMEIYAAATLFQRDIYIFSPDHGGSSYRWLLFTPQQIQNTRLDTQHGCNIALCHTYGNHYDRIAPFDSSFPCNCCLSLPRLSGNRFSIDLTGEH